MNNWSSQQPQSQPGWIDARTAESGIRERAFMSKVYGWMFTGMLLTMLSSMAVVMSPSLQQMILGNRGVFMILLLVEIGVVFFLMARASRMSAGAAAASFIGYSLLNGLTLSTIFFAYTTGSLVRAFGVAAGTFGAMSLYGMVTKRDLTSWGAFFRMGVFGLIICMLVNMFLHSSPLDWTISVIGVFVFLGLTAYDTQKLKNLASSPQGNLAIIGALILYLDFVNLFLFILRLFGGRRN
jgi:FtsH-binding integral membrane protein